MVDFKKLLKEHRNMTTDFKQFGAQVADETGKDMTKATAGRELPPEGMAGLRFVSYVELGSHESGGQFGVKVKPKARFVFELSGPLYPVKEFDGQKVAPTVSFELPISTSSKSHYNKLLSSMNLDGKAKNFFGLLGDAYGGQVFHRKYATGQDDKSKPETWSGVAVDLTNPQTKASSIGRAVKPEIKIVDGEPEPTGRMIPRTVPPAITQITGLSWDLPQIAHWDGLYIAGQYEAEIKDGVEIRKARSKNFIQNKILSAKNFHGSPLELLLQNAGRELDLPSPEEVDAEDTPPDLEDVPDEVVTRPARGAAKKAKAPADMDDAALAAAALGE